MSIITQLFTTKEGFALLAVVAGALLFMGTKREVIEANIFPIRRQYDFRNKRQVSAQQDPVNDPFYSGITSLKISSRHRKWH